MKQKAYLMAGYSAVAVGLCAWYGQDLNWDLLNYHFYNPYMFLNGRIDSDVHAAGLQSFYNPLIDLPLYAAVSLHVPPLLFFLALAAYHGLIPFLIHLIAAALFSGAPSPMITTIGLLSGATAAFGAAFQTEVGNTMHDNTLSVFLLTALWLLVQEFGPKSHVSPRNILLAGALAGLVTGTKLSMAPFSVGLLAAVVMLPGSARTRVTRAISFCTVVCIGLAATGGYWMWLMYSHFGSPLFPYFNAVFQSPFAPVENFLDRRFLPTTVLQAIFYPFYWVSTQTLVAEIPFRDARFATVVVFLSMFGLQQLFSVVVHQRQSTETGTLLEPLARRLLVVAVFWVVSYVIWLKLFSIYRYAIALEALSGVLIIAVAALLTGRWPNFLALAVPVCLVMWGAVRPPDYGRIPWSESYFGVDNSGLEKYAGATVVMWDFPQAYVVPSFPPSSRFVRLLSNWGLESDTAMWPRVVEAITLAGSRLYVLDHPQKESAGTAETTTIESLGLRRSDRCETYQSHSGGFRLCALERNGAKAKLAIKLEAATPRLRLCGEASTDMYFDQVGPAQLPAFGSLIPIRQTRTFKVSGWAVDRPYASTAAAVDVVIDEMPFPAVYGSDRPDVATSLGQQAYRASGFVAEIPGDILSRGRHTLRARIVASNGDCYYETPQIALGVE